MRPHERAQPDEHGSPKPISGKPTPGEPISGKPTPGAHRPERLNCRQIGDSLDSYVADELPAAARRTFELHLALCPPCVNLVDSYKATIELEKGACCEESGLPELPPALIQAILKARRTGIN